MPLPEEIVKDWPDDLKTDPSLKDFKDVASLAKSYRETKALVGSSIRIPGKEAGPEALKEFATSIAEKVAGVVYLPDDPTAREIAVKDLWRKLGRPEKPEEYVVDGAQLMPDTQFNEDELKAMRDLATARGYTKEQFRALLKSASEAKAAETKEERENRAALQRELGAAFEERTLVASLTAEKLGFPDEVVKALRHGTMDLQTYKAFAAVAKGFGGERHVAEQTGVGNGKLTPAEAKTQRAEIMARQEYFNPKPGQMDVHRSLVAKVQDLNAVIDAAEG